LDRDRVGDGVNEKREFDQEAVASGLHDPVFVFGSLGIDQFAPMRLQPR
jgi:hypothetical protein